LPFLVTVRRSEPFRMSPGRRRAAVVFAEPSANPVRNHPHTAYARNGNTLRG
jgi:hypothetical protein